MDDKWLAMAVQRQADEMEMLKQAFSGLLEDDDIYAERQRLGDVVHENKWPSELYLIINNSPTGDVMGLADRIERAAALGDWDSLIDEARDAGVPGLWRPSRFGRG